MTPSQNRTLCAYCREPHGRSAGHVNRALKIGSLIFCGRVCSGLSRRQWVPVEQRKAEKRLYDIEYRRKNRAMLKAKKAAYYQRTRDPEKERAHRQKNMARHVEYCRRPEYRLKKKAYDEKRRDSKYGAFADAARLAIDLNREIKGRMSNYEIRLENQTLSKTQARRRAARETPGRG